MDKVFIAASKETPNDPATLAAYRDWLMEQGRPEDAARLGLDLYSLSCEIRNIFDDWENIHIEPIANGWEIKCWNMYSPGELGYRHLKMVATLFGTDNVDLDNFEEGGCESCDYGSRYGFTVQVRHLALHAHLMRELSGKYLRER